MESEQTIVTLEEKTKDDEEEEENGVWDMYFVELVAAGRINETSLKPFPTSKPSDFLPTLSL